MGKRLSVGVVTVFSLLPIAHAGPFSHAESAFSLSIRDGFAADDVGPKAKEVVFHHGDDLIVVDWYAPDRAPSPVDPATFATYHRAPPPHLHRTVEQQLVIPHG